MKYQKEYEQVKAWNQEVKELLRKVDPTNPILDDPEDFYEVAEKKIEIGILNGYSIEQQMTVMKFLIEITRKKLTELDTIV